MKMFSMLLWISTYEKKTIQIRSYETHFLKVQVKHTIIRRKYFPLMIVFTTKNKKKSSCN